MAARSDLPHQRAATSMLEVEFAQVSDPGRVRGNNEDYVGHVAPANAAQARTHGWLFALADGVGGQDKGEVASRAAVERLIAGFRDAASGESHSSLLPRLVQSANTLVYETGMAAGPGGTAMATTLVACGLRHDRAVVVHVGDSRCYLIRAGEARQLTRDHTVVNEQIRLGILSGRDASEAVTRHVLSRSLGNDLFVNVDCSVQQLQVGDVLLLCSDGLHGAVEPPEMIHALQHSDLPAAAQRMVDLANHRDGSDNISVELIRIRNVERMGMYRGRPYKLP